MLGIGPTLVSLTDLAYEDEELASLVTRDDVRRLCPDKHPIPSSARDEGRWRRVLSEIQGAERVDVEAALAMFAWPDGRPPEWYVRLTDTALAAGISISGHRCIVRADGTTIAPPTPRSGAILVLDAEGSAAAVALGLAVPLHEVYSSDEPAATRVRAWLEKHSTLRDAASGRDAIASLAAREAPTYLTDEKLLVLREVLFTALRSDERKSLGAKVGAVVLVDGYEFEPAASRRTKAKRRKVMVAPAEAYLPAAIDATGKRSWPTAAGTVPGIRWISGRYREVISRQDERRGARAFFTALGAAATPRLVEREQPEYRYNAPAFRRLAAPGRLQQDAIDRLDGWPTHVIEEMLSPDLDLVMADLVVTPVRLRRERARALLSTIAEHWRNDYAAYAEVQAVHSDYSWVVDGVVPAAWLSRLASAPWLSNQQQKPKPPMDLAVPTPRALEVFGNEPSVYGAEFSILQPRHYPALEAMGTTVDPTVSHIIDALKELKSTDPGGGQATVAKAAALYDLLAESCAVLDGAVEPDSSIGDSTVRAVRAAFGIGKAKGKGLIVAEGAWWTPHMVFRGRPIFGSRRAFVPERRRADRLWDVLNVRRPSIRDCLDVLDEIAEHPLTDADLGIVVETYRYLATLAARTADERDALSRVPLWSGSQWIRRRPIFAVDDPQVTTALAEHEPVWQAPVPLASLGELPARFGVTVLDLTRFGAVGIDGLALARGAKILHQFRDAVGHLRARFARRDAAAFEQVRPSWKGLENSRVAVTPDLGIEVRITGRPELTVGVRAHVQHLGDDLVFAVASADAAGEEEAGGRAIASLFVDETDHPVDRDKVALAWSAAWRKAGEGVMAEALRLPEARDGGELDPLSGLEADLRTAKAWRSSENLLERRKAGRGARQEGGPSIADDQPSSPTSAQAPLAMRHLKGTDDLVIGDVTVHAGVPALPTGHRTGKPPRLSDPPPPDTERRTSEPHASTVPRAYTDEEREALAVDVLRRILETDTRTLRDLRKVAHLGADVVDNLEKYFEIKASAGDMPDVISLRYSQIERSVERPPGQWFLAVVAGLEIGYETKVRFIADPLRHLSWADNGSVTFAGVRSARAVEITLPERDEGP
jgi:hypothetical protein